MIILYACDHQRHFPAEGNRAVCRRNKEAFKGGAKVVGTGRSDYPNQINNVLVFPGLFRGALDVRAKEITEGMKLAAAKALASLVSDEELSESYIIPSALDERAAETVAEAVATEARNSGVARV